MGDDDHTMVHIDDLKPAGVASEEGWKEMDIRFFDGSITGSKNACLFRTIFTPEAAHERHYHPNADEFIYVVSGRAAKSSPRKPSARWLDTSRGSTPSVSESKITRLVAPASLL